MNTPNRRVKFPSSLSPQSTSSSAPTPTPTPTPMTWTPRRAATTPMSTSSYSSTSSSSSLSSPPWSLSSSLSKTNKQTRKKEKEKKKRVSPMMTMPGTKVFVKDDVYAWLPAEIAESSSASKGGNERKDDDDDDDDTVLVYIDLPSDWNEFTAFPDHPSLRRGVAATGSNDKTGSGGGDRSSGGRTVRRVKLSDYPGGELPLQNVISVAPPSPTLPQPPSATTLKKTATAFLNVVEAASTYTADDEKYHGSKSAEKGEKSVQAKKETSEMLGKSDMADLPHLHEAAILYNLKDRHKRSVPYTRVGDIVVAVNPYRWIDGLYSEKKRHFYADRLVWNVDEDYTNRQDITRGYYDRLTHDPHVYETSSHAYRGLLANAEGGRDQAILVSGESGAGKTETVKIVMAHLAMLETTAMDRFAAGLGGGVGNSGDEDDCFYVVPTNAADAGADAMHSKIVSKIADSNPLFEAFGNARTVRNDNSSRFGKVTKLRFVRGAPVGGGGGMKEGGLFGSVRIPTLAGGTFETYLLEKSRVVTHGPGERTFHFFYQLLSAPANERAEFWEEGLVGGDGSAAAAARFESFRYVGLPPTDSTENKTADAQAWAETKAALEQFGLMGENLREFIRAACAVLQLGNVAFGPIRGGGGGGGGGCVIETPEELDRLSSLVGISSSDLTSALTSRRFRTGGEEINVRLSPESAKDGRDALAKELYAQVFQVLVDAINRCTNPRTGDGDGDGDKRCITILDMFGFESFDVNRFEQLCINYANERVQHKYASDMFLSVKSVYEAEGIEIFDFSKVDNTDILDLIESRTGLISVLNEECVRPSGNDESFVYKIKTIHKGSECLISERLHRPWEFAIAHYAGVVKYTSQGFVDRNTDKIPPDLLECVRKSGNDLIRRRLQMVESVNASSTRSRIPKKRGAPTITTKFKTQLTCLMSDIKEARTRYIRCIKPNSTKQPLVLDHEMAMRQLASAGLVTAITVSRETFPNNLPYDVIWDRFHVLLAMDAKPWDKPIRERARFLLETKLQGLEKVVGGHVIAPFACGKTKVFFRSGSLEQLESERQEVYAENAIILQRWARAFMAEKRYKAIEPSVVVLQAKWRCKVERMRYVKMRNAALAIQCWCRRKLASSMVIQRKQFKAAAAIQSIWRMQKPRGALRRAQKAARIIQRMMKAALNQNKFTAAMAIVVEDAQMNKKMKLLQKRLTNRRPDERDELLDESAMMIEYLSRQLFKQRGRVSNLKAEVAQKEEQSAAANLRARSMEAALAANKLEVGKLRNASIRLESRLSEQRASRASMNMVLKGIQDEQKIANAKLQAEKELIRNAYKKEIITLKDELRLVRVNHAREMLQARYDMSKKEEEHRTEVLKLQEDIRRMEESHGEDLSKMLNALETAHEHVTEPRDVPDEDEVFRLKREVEELKAKHESEIRDWTSMLCDRCFRMCEGCLSKDEDDSSHDNGGGSSESSFIMRGSLSRGRGSRKIKPQL